ncbi:MAG: DUF3035 domain-containing protein [bacterium]
MVGSMRLMLVLGLSAITISGCASIGKTLGVGKTAPDEFAIVTKAPLTLPPDYALKPPRPGETRPQEASPSERAQQLLLGDETQTPPTPGELALIEEVGALNVDPNIRAILAAENGGRGYKEADLANRILFWRVAGGKVDDSDAPLVVDNPNEWHQARQISIEKVTGGQQVTINKTGKVLNLPGVR